MIYLIDIDFLLLCQVWKIFLKSIVPVPVAVT